MLPRQRRHDAEQGCRHEKARDVDQQSSADSQQRNGNRRCQRSDGLTDVGAESDRCVCTRQVVGANEQGHRRAGGRLEYLSDDRSQPDEDQQHRKARQPQRGDGDQGRLRQLTAHHDPLQVEPVADRPGQRTEQRRREVADQQ